MMSSLIMYCVCVLYDEESVLIVGKYLCIVLKIRGFGIGGYVIVLNRIMG